MFQQIVTFHLLSLHLSKCKSKNGYVWAPSFVGQAQNKNLRRIGIRIKMWDTLRMIHSFWLVDCNPLHTHTHSLIMASMRTNANFRFHEIQLNKIIGFFLLYFHLTPSLSRPFLPPPKLCWNTKGGKKLQRSILYVCVCAPLGLSVSLLQC